MNSQTPFSHKAKKSLGQNFLTSHLYAKTLVKSSLIEKGECVIEVGPGKGVITKELLTAGAYVIAVEKDDALYEQLLIKFKEDTEKGNLKLIHGDILTFEPDTGGVKGVYSVVGSIPYNITGVFLRTMLTKKNYPEKIGLIIQREVATRIVARDGKESLLSLSIKAFGEPEYIKTIRREEFTPKPKVDSAILIIKNISQDFFKDFSQEIFFKVLRAGYAQKRKKLISNLRTLYDKKSLEDAFAKVGLQENVRAEELPLSRWYELLVALEKK